MRLGGLWLHVPSTFNKTETTIILNHLAALKQFCIEWLKKEDYSDFWIDLDNKFPDVYSEYESECEGKDLIDLCDMIDTIRNFVDNITVGIFNNNSTPLKCFEFKLSDCADVNEQHIKAKGRQVVIYFAGYDDNDEGDKGTGYDFIEILYKIGIPNLLYHFCYEGTNTENFIKNLEDK